MTTASIIRVRYTGTTHQAVDDHTGAKCTSTASHEWAAFALLRKQGFDVDGGQVQLLRLYDKEKEIRNPRLGLTGQWQVYKVVVPPKK